MKTNDAALLLGHTDCVTGKDGRTDTRPLLYTFRYGRNRGNSGGNNRNEKMQTITEDNRLVDCCHVDERRRRRKNVARHDRRQ